MSDKGECSAWNKNAWGVRNGNEVEEPIVSFVEIMSEDLVNAITDEDRRKEEDIIRAFEMEGTSPTYDNDEEMARALQREFDREYDISVRLQEENQNKGKKTVTMTPDRYCPKTVQESEDESSDDEETREMATALLYAKLDSMPAAARTPNGEIVTKHDLTESARRNADKTLNDNVNLLVGDMSSEKISSKIFNSLRSFGKTEIKRQHKLKDKEEKATMDTSVDGTTRMLLFKWINQGLFDRVEGIIATGKESAVLHAVGGADDSENFAIKVYKTSLNEFKNRSDYVKDDFRFKNPRGVLKIWAEKEFMNLTRMSNKNLPCPTPIKLKSNLLVMGHVGEAGVAAPKLKNVDWDFFTEEERTDVYQQVESIMCRMYKDCMLVHGDLSEFNLLMSEGKVYVIDVSQAMDLSHPQNLRYLCRDINNILSFFSRIDTPNLPTAAALFNIITELQMTEDTDLLVQVEHFSKDNRCVTLRNDKQRPADMEMRQYLAERPPRGPSPAREYN